MNSAQGLRGFITFLILLAILTTGFAGFNYISQPVSNVSEADEPQVEPLNVTVVNITDSSAEITWSTVSPASSRVVYSRDMGADCLTSVKDTEDAACTYYNLTEAQTSQKATLTDLSPEVTYFFRILTNGRIYPADISHSFRTANLVSSPIESSTSAVTDNDDYEGFGQVNIGEPEVIRLNTPSPVLGVQDENIAEPVDPLGDIAAMMQSEFKEAMTYNDSRYDLNKDGFVTMADYPLFINFVMNYED